MISNNTVSGDVRPWFPPGDVAVELECQRELRLVFFGGSSFLEMFTGLLALLVLLLALQFLLAL